MSLQITATPASILTQSVGIGPASSKGTPIPMPDAVRLQLAGNVEAEGFGATGGARSGRPPVLTAPVTSVTAATGTMQDGGARLRSVMLAAIGARDPVAHEEGADARLSERSAGAVAWLASSPVTLLLSLAREVLLKAEKVARESNVRNVSLSYDTAVRSAALLVETATTRMWGDVGAAVVGTGIGAMSMRQSVKASTRNGKAIGIDKQPAKVADAVTTDEASAMKAVQVPAGKVRPDRDFKEPGAAGAGAADRADAGSNVASDNASTVPQMGREAQAKTLHTEAKRSHIAGDVVDKDVHLTMAKATYISALMAPISAVARSIAEIDAQRTDEAMKILAKAAEVVQDTAREEGDQGTKTRDSRDMFSRLVEQFIERDAATSAHIIKGF